MLLAGILCYSLLNPPTDFRQAFVLIEVDDSGNYNVLPPVKLLIGPACAYLLPRCYVLPNGPILEGCVPSARWGSLQVLAGLAHLADRLS